MELVGGFKMTGAGVYLVPQVAYTCIQKVHIHFFKSLISEYLKLNPVGVGIDVLCVAI